MEKDTASCPRPRRAHARKSFKLDESVESHSSASSKNSAHGHRKTAETRNKTLSSSSSLGSIPKRCNRDVTESTTIFDVTVPEAMSQLARLANSGYHSLILYRQFKDQRNLDEAIICFQLASGMCPRDHPSHSVSLFNLATVKFVDCRDNKNYVDIQVSFTLYRDALQLRRSGHVSYCGTALDLCFALLAQLQRRGDEIMVQAQNSASTVVKLSPVKSYAYQAAWLAFQMAEITISVRTFESGLTQADTAVSEDALICKARNILTDLPDLDPDRPKLLAVLGGMLYHRFNDNDNIVDVHEAIFVLQNAVNLAPDGHPDKPAWLNDFGNSLFRRFERLGNIADVNDSISIFEHALHLTPDDHVNKPVGLNNLANSLSRRFERLGDLADINKSVSMREEAVRLTPDGDPDKPTWLSNLGSSLSRRFRYTGNIADLNESVSVLREAALLVSDDHPDKRVLLSSLACSIFHHSEHSGNLADLSDSISVFEEALRLTPSGHPTRPSLLNNVGNALLGRFQRLGDLADINRGILVTEEAVYLTPDDHPAKPDWLNNLGSSLYCRFERLGNLVDINKSILMTEQAERLTPDGHPDKPSRLTGLGNSLASRFMLLGDIADINKSITVSEKAVHLTPDGHRSKPGWLCNLGKSLCGRFERLGDITDLDKSISVVEEALRLTPHGHFSKPISLTNLGNSLLSRFQHLGDVADIDKSISAGEEAVRCTPEGHPQKPSVLNNLGTSFSCRFEHLGDIADIKQSILAFGEAANLAPSGYSHKIVFWNNLGNAFTVHYKHSGDSSSLSAATLNFSLASRTSTGATSTRFQAARRWIYTAHLEGDSQALYDAYTTAVDLLPELAWLGLPLPERHRVLLKAADIARDAAAFALETSCPQRAVECLEQGRSIVWGQLLQLRTPVDELGIEHPDLARRFQEISKELEHARSRDSSTFHGLVKDLASDVGSSEPFEKEVQRHHELALRREELLGEIRSLPGFERFLLPKTLEQLAALAHSGPVVYLNASQQRCDALIVREGVGSVISVPLPDIHYSQVDNLYGLLRLLLEHGRLIISRDAISALVTPDENLASCDMFERLLRGDGIEGSERAAKIKPQRIEGYSTDELFCQILAYLWNRVVWPVLKALGFSTPPSGDEKLTRIFWCPTGPFAFLPIHAAGLYDTEPGPKLSDFVISSYIPTLSALAPSSQKHPLPATTIRLTAVPQPPTDGLSWLALVQKEIDHIKTLCSTSPFVSLQECDGTIEDVVEKMKSSDWVHFACHGVQDPRNPLDSGLCLADGCRLKLSDIIRLSRPQGGRGLAFLSACQTAQGDEKLSEESVHLSAGMLLAGYGGVIGTMWGIRDPDAPRVARDVYERLFFRDGKTVVVPESTGAAGALRRAVERLRDSGAPFASWVPFIHVGR